jgi:hypothetical protein
MEDADNIQQDILQELVDAEFGKLPYDNIRVFPYDPGV